MRGIALAEIHLLLGRIHRRVIVEAGAAVVAAGAKQAAEWGASEVENAGAAAGRR